jgi:hypothetical protein
VATWRDVSHLALALPQTREEASNEGRRSWLVSDKMFAWERPLRRSDKEALGAAAPTGPILGVRTDGLEMKEALIAADPNVYFTTPHFNGYPAVLVQLKNIARSELKDLLYEAWFAHAPKRVAAEHLAKARKVKAAK